jgi:surfeit locus 1 family protein
VALQLGSRTFAPALASTALALLGIVSVSYLGLWQLDRAAEKRAILEQIAAGESATRQLTTASTELPRYQTVSATGHYDTSHQVLLDNMPSLHGMPGYRVLTPFELQSGEWILVDRGWLRVGASRSILPAIDVATNERTIVGRLDDIPRPGIRLGTQANSEGWPRVMNFPQHADLERVLERKLGPRIVRLDPKQSDGYERSFAVRSDFGPNRHIAYAVQWFALAATMLVVYLVLNFKAKKRHDHSESV